MTSAAAILIEHGKALFDAQRRFHAFTGHPDADRMLNDLERFPHAFVLACVGDRQIKSERAWLIPHELAQRLGGFSFRFLAEISPERLRQVFCEPTPLHRLPEKMSEFYHDAIRLIEDRYDGDAASIWEDTPPSAEVVLRFLAFRGVGPKIATMATNLLARRFKIRFSDYYSVDVSVDVHLKRVFRRLGLTSDGASHEEIVYRARALHPEFPGLLDFPAWEIGRSWCRPTNPKCAECYMASVCPSKRI